MKVLHVIPSMSFAHGGPSHAIRLTERVLSEQGVEVETLTTDDNGPYERNGKRIGEPLKENGVVRRYFPKRLEFYKVSPGLATWVNHHVRDYDLVHIHALFSFSSVAAAWAARSAGVPYVVRPLGTLNRYGVENRRPLLKRLSLMFIEGPILRHAAAVHFTSEAEREEAESLGIPMKSEVIPLGIEPLPKLEVRSFKSAEWTNPFLKQYPHLADAHIVLYLSRLDPKKNLEGLLRAFSRMVEPDPSNPPTLAKAVWGSGLKRAMKNNLMLVIAGDGEPAYVASLHKLARELGLSEEVMWTGQLGGDVKAGAFKAARVFVLPSFSENFGIAAAEALSSGLPCVLGSGVAIATEVADAGAGLLVPTDAKAIAVALNSILEDDELCAEMGRKATALAAERYSLEAMGKGLHDLYSRILSEKVSGQSE